MNYKNIIKGFDIVSGSEINEKLVDYANNGALRGVYLGFPNIHKHYTMSLPGVTDWTGFPSSGKTQILMEFLINTSEWYGWKHLIYFPDVGDDREIISDLIHKKTGKTFDKRYPNRITEEEIAQETPWILEHFKILTKNDLKAKLTPYEFWDLAVKLKEKEGLHTACIDAWKDMRHDTTKFGRDDKYLEDVLSYRNAVSDRHKLHFHTIIHPLKTDKDGAGNRKPPGPYDLKGGTEWFNNGRNMVTAHRPTGANDNMVEIYWNKIKPRSIGDVGKDEIYFDLKKFRYFWDDNGENIYAEKTLSKSKERETIEQNEDADDLPF
jgi:hypothetical protein